MKNIKILSEKVQILNTQQFHSKKTNRQLYHLVMPLERENSRMKRNQKKGIVDFEGIITRNKRLKTELKIHSPGLGDMKTERLCVRMSENTKLIEKTSKSFREIVDPTGKNYIYDSLNTSISKEIMPFDIKNELEIDIPKRNISNQNMDEISPLGNSKWSSN